MLRDGGEVEVGEISCAIRSLQVYNIQVSGPHTYSVGKSGVVVHNKPMRYNPKRIPGKKHFRGPKGPKRAFQHLEDYHGIPQRVASNRLHAIKARYGLGAADDVIIGGNGGVYNAATGEYLGTLTDPIWGGGKR